MVLVARLPLCLTSYLPGIFESSIPLPGENIGNSTSTFVSSTNTTDPGIAEQLAAAAQAPFISFSDEFDNLLGPEPAITLVDDQEGNLFAFETGPWIPSRNEFWFTSAIYSPPGRLQILNLETLTITEVPVKDGWKNFQRGFYRAETDEVLFTTYRDNGTYRGGLVSINPNTHNITPVFNSFNGLFFSGMNEIAVLAENDRSYFFVSDTDFIAQAYPTGLEPIQMFTGLYRWDSRDAFLRPVLSQATLPGINAVKFTPDLQSLYVGAGGPGGTAIPYQATIWKYDLDNDHLPVNPRLFAAPRFFHDGIQVDDAGRVWSCEGDGVVVRDSEGRQLGIINKLYFGRNIQFANLGLAGNLLIILAGDRLWTVRLTQSIVTEHSRHYFG